MALLRFFLFLTAFFALDLRRHATLAQYYHVPQEVIDIAPDYLVRLPMRHDKEWYFRELEGSSTVTNLIKHYRGSNGLVDEYSNIRYTCDEFPPASWVEGGDGEDHDQPANTRCAAMRCQAGVKAEQDWQATAHNRLRSDLKRVITIKLNVKSFSNKDSVAFFKFYPDNRVDGVAARVWTYVDVGNADAIDKSSPVNQGFNKRDVKGWNLTADPQGRTLWDLSFEELRALMDAGHGYEHQISANMSYVDWAMASQTPIELQNMDPHFRWDDEDEEYEDFSNATRAKRYTKPAPVKKAVVPKPKPAPVPRSIPAHVVTPLLKRANSSDIENARSIPLRNVNTKTLATGNSSVNAGVTPLLQITPEIAKAAALVAEANGVAKYGNVTKRAAAATGTYWMQDLARKGTVPWGDDASYVVFRNVLNYGAVGDGVTDDTEAINYAMTDGKRCSEKCNGSTTKNAIVYFPLGNYLISSTVPIPFGTQVIGDANERPTLVASADFISLGGAEEYYIRNIVIDITGAGVAQATSLQNVELIASTNTATNQIGIFNGCGIGVHVIWDWGWVIGFKLVSDDGSGNIGSVSVLDSSFTSVATAALQIAALNEAPGTGSTGVILENVKLSGVAAAVWLDGSAGTTVTEWTLGPTYEGTTTARTYTEGGKVGDYRRHSTLLDADGAYFERAKPQYEDKVVGDFVHIKDMGVTGDGFTDDTAAFQAALYASQGKILFIDAGSYILTSTIVIPPGTKIVGETWSQLVASGSYFEDVGTVGSVGDVEIQDILFTTRGATAGLILIEWNIQAASQGSAGMWDCHARIGGAVGSQLTLTECPPLTSGTDAGCSAASLMMRLTSLASGYFENVWLWGADHMIDDPLLDDSTNDMEQCSIYIARGFLIESTHATWLYATASEHSVFYQYNFYGAANIFAGMLQTESLYFQLTPPPPAPFAAVVGDFPGDPDYTCAADNEFNGCDESWSTIITGSQNIFIAAAGIYTWFSTYAQTCIDSQECQKVLMKLENNFASVRIENLITIGAKYMAVMDGEGILAADNMNGEGHPFWSQVTLLDVGSNGTTNFNELVWIDPKIWDMDKPSFTCLPPYLIQLPPYTAATSTVNYPLMTVSDGTWTSTVTMAPLTISEWVLEVVTITADGSAGGAKKGKRAAQGFAEFTPVAVSTPLWPSISYLGNDGQATTTAPSVAFPTPPAGVVARGVTPYQGTLDWPTVDQCFFYSTQCIPDPWMYCDLNDAECTAAGDDGSDPGDDDENLDDLAVTCPAGGGAGVATIVSSSSSTTTTTTSTSAIPSPMETGDPEENVVDCYNSGETTENARMQSSGASFCNSIAGDNFGPGYFHQGSYDFPYNGGVGFMRMVISLEILAGCDWKYNLDDCERYLRVLTDSCNCGGVDGK
ncbi:glucan 1,3-beta-glucosidase [Diplogelasinospora grovesii]|uniref:Glucan 1,3-beta-glucosidase n=1 Tax=Diplogelasinospora grovesii TaxID=303347 RepID=A0AAN6RYK5_9PEZI|nr:glucan 1,3-beta-glucosidase [Diplogelasinospora grovesii]